MVLGGFEILAQVTVCAGGGFVSPGGSSHRQ